MPQDPTALENRDRLRALYDAAPYPHCLDGRSQQNNLLLPHWINAVHGFDRPVLSPNSRILVAGCGTGAEVLVLANLYPQASIVGIDFSERSIALARELADRSGFEHLRFEVVDLMDSDGMSRYASFDFILCFGVADYVVDPALLLQNLAACLSDKGLMYLVCNSPHHPAHRIRQAFAQLGQSPETFDDTPDQRNLLQLTTQLMGSDAKIFGLGNAAKAYLKVDIFPPIAHHLSIDTWLNHAQQAGLCFAGAMEAPLALAQVSDAQLPLLYGLDKAALSVWMLKLCQRAAMQLLFSRQAAPAPSFTDLDRLGQWKPRLDACLGVLPDLEGDPFRARNITLRFEAGTEFVIYSNAYDLAVLRRCNGQRTLADIRTEIGVVGDEASLLACLYRAYQYGLLA